MATQVFVADYGVSVDKKKNDFIPNKTSILENPLKSRPPPPLRNDNAIVLRPTTNELRQRRPLAEQQIKSPLYRPLPTSSMSLGTAPGIVPVNKSSNEIFERRRTDLALPPSTSKGCWVLVYGIATKNHRDECLDHFGKIGNVSATRDFFSPGQCNWIALQYESSLQAHRACCQSSVNLQDNLFCGVKLLDDDDPILTQIPASTLEEAWEETGSAPRKLITTSSGEITERDILLGKKDEDVIPKKRGCFERLLCAILGIDD